MKLYIIWGILLLSGGLLSVLLLKNRFAFQWVGKLCLHLAFACIMLYILNLFSSYTHLELPLNVVTVGTVGVLGIPGLAALAALKLWVL
ncbi:MULTISPECIES: pro-sigmaK processing inhibitor BofA family protein [unclassified Paenibacillus]|uniref:pro-sigmaK processing inhibitor BofA family protein n=1 Tax=unclassified Paenibacillus TaxID=185978 RepID=UPI001AEB81E1|nr:MULTISPECIES: pro-sigmaK processing inhibitor BofA family protein [unclassified Paenibacillus]MBP1153454.1 inhibitor of the pro-sigma K processing machinery [Paenibacillus sp. PvP091]MBP1171163.1 inhibitor of the pro-sigma K processing machinery [Paenibacillus sp. PvR098]MBP2442191.1 inhibitor of the pro-sigma K processing machinery [Paenibacillus sp. PvP052]